MKQSVQILKERLSEEEGHLARFENNLSREDRGGYCLTYLEGRIRETRNTVLDLRKALIVLESAALDAGQEPDKNAGAANSSK